MKTIKISSILGGLFAACTTIYAGESRHINYPCREQSPLLQSTVGRLIDLNKNVFSATTLGVIFLGGPAYSLARQFDQHMQCNFYCKNHHRNIHQFPSHAYKGMNIGLGIMMGGLSALSFLPNDTHLRRTSRLYALSLPYTWGVKNLLKQIEHPGNIRPKNQFFSKSKKYYGGCPSGHAMEVFYSALLYSLEGGPAFGVPLWLFAGAISAELINCNRHYSSQVIAGAGLGIIFGLAAHKTLKDTNDQWYSVNMVHENNEFALRAQCRF